MERSEFERLVRAHQAAVYAAARRAAGEEAAALDAVQQVFLRLLQGRLSLADAVDEQRVLRCAAIREVAMARRSGRRRTAREQRYAMLSDREHHDRGLEGAEAGRTVAQALSELPAPLRSALVLRFHEQLSFAEIGALLSISAASAHERVQRGLERLRGRLARAGLAGLLVDPAALWPTSPTPPAPPALAQRLLALEAGVGLPALPALLAAALALGGLSAGLYFFAPLGPPPDGAQARGPRSGLQGPADLALAADPAAPGPAREAREVLQVPAAPAPGAPAAPGAPLDAPALGLGHLEGRVVDVFGLGLAGVEVEAATAELEGKAPRHAARVRSGPDGAFRLELPAFAASGSAYRLRAATAGGWQAGPGGVVRAGQTTGAAPLALPTELVEAPGDWTLELRVADAEGRAVAGAEVRLLASVRGPTGATWLEARAEGRTDAAGGAELSGSGLGPRLLSIDARAAGLAPAVERLELGRPGRLSLSRRLAPGLELRGRLLGPAGGPVGPEQLGSSELPLFARGIEPERWYRAESDGPGRFRIPALPPGPIEVWFRHEGWSDFRRVVEPGRGELEFVLKPEAEAVDTGSHDAELHGRLFAAGRPVPVEPLTATLFPIPDDHPALADGDYSALLLCPVVAQTMQVQHEGADLPEPPAQNAFVFDGLEPGRYLVRIGAAGFAPRLLGPFELGEREIRGGLEVELTPGASLEARLLDPQGQPLRGGRLLLLGPGELSRQRLEQADRELAASGGRGFQLYSGPASDGDGRLRLEHLPAGERLQAWLLHPEHAPAPGPWLSLDERQPIALDLPAGPRR